MGIERLPHRVHWLHALGFQGGEQLTINQLDAICPGSAITLRRSILQSALEVVQHVQVTPDNAASGVLMCHLALPVHTFLKISEFRPFSLPAIQVFLGFEAQVLQFFSQGGDLFLFFSFWRTDLFYKFLYRLLLLLKVFFHLVVAFIYHVSFPYLSK